MKPGCWAIHWFHDPAHVAGTTGFPAMLVGGDTVGIPPVSLAPVGAADDGGAVVEPVDGGGEAGGVVGEPLAKTLDTVGSPQCCHTAA
jgi:hypothetical protein